MRNLKKILALVLVLVMSFSLVSVASAKFADSDKVNAKFATAVEVLNGLKVFQGYEDGTFNPTGAITRAEVAAIIYRIDTGDVAGKQVSIYADYNKFDDVKSTAWYAGYVNYCANATYIKGYDENTFGPNDKVTGYQALAMIMRVVGYDKNGEFSGSAWQIETAKYAQKLGITKNVDVNTLGVAATRELVAELLFRTILEVPQVTYTLLQGYNQYQDTFPTATSKLNPTIGEERFGLATYATNDDWGRPVTGWTSFGRPIVTIAETPVATYVEPVDQCTIVKETGVKGPVAHWVNGVEGQNVITATHNAVNHIMGEQGTVLEVYASGVIVEIDTYLARVTGTVKAGYDKNGHMYRAPYNEFTLFNAPVDTVFVDGNDYTTGDFWLVNYNEELEYVLPYAVPATENGKQTYIWWNASKHTINDKVFMDNANYGAEFDAAGYDKSAEYTWFFDKYNNVIGSAEIIIPEAEKSYAVVLGAQWINYIGKNGEALAKIFYLNGETVDGVKVSKVNGIEMSYADTYLADFASGTVCTTYQYNKNTEATLYEVKAGLELTPVTTDLDVVIYDGVSRLGTSDYYCDNNTTFFFYNVKTDNVDVTVGYDNLNAKYGYTCQDVDVIVDQATGFAKFVYIPSYTTNPAPQGPATPDTVVNEFIYITGDAMNYKLADKFALLGVVDGEGNTDALYFSKSFAGSESATEAYLNNLVKFGQDMLFYVTVTNGNVTAITPVALDAEFAGDKAGNALFVGADEFFFIGTGVMVLEDGTALNVNHNTVVINEGKVGSAVNNMDYVYGSNLYVIYEGTTAKAIFVTPTAKNFVVNGTEMTMADAMVMSLTAADLNDVSAAFTYVAEDMDAIDYAAVSAQVAEAVKAGTALTMIDGLYGDDAFTVTVAYNAQTKLFDVTVASAAVSTTVSIYITVIDVETALKAAYALEDGQALDFTVTLTGEITAINTVWSEQYKNITVTIKVEGFETMPVMCYRLAGEGAKDLAVGDIITVTGVIKNYKGTIEFDQGCTLDAVVKGEGEVIELTTPEEILTAAYALAEGESLPGVYTLTGVIKSIDTEYSEQYKNITVTIVIEGFEEMPLVCYRLKGEGAATLQVGDTITVTGSIMNYRGTVEFPSGCTLDAVTKA